MSALFAFCKERFKSKPYLFLLAAYVLFCLASCVYFAIISQTRNAFLSIAYALIALAVPLVEHLFNLRCGNLFIFITLLLPVGGLLGTAYDFYTLIPVFDTLLHTHSGFLFACVGFALMKRILKNENTPTANLACLLFAFFFSLGIAVLWEMFEYASTELLGVDMQEDMLVNQIRSYLLAGGHNDITVLENITQTIIVYGDGQIYTVEGGYLDLGVFDTLIDMLVCLIGAIFFLLLLGVDKPLFKGKIQKSVIPTVLLKTDDL